MKCPACSGNLTTVNVGPVALDVCQHGCGGIWFDKDELEQFDEESEAIDNSLLFQSGLQNVVLDRSKVRRCPKCADSKMQRIIYDAVRDIELDHCSACQGVWVDPGELRSVRESTTAKNERAESLKTFMSSHGQSLSSGKLPEKMRAVFELLFR